MCSNRIALMSAMYVCSKSSRLHCCWSTKVELLKIVTRVSLWDALSRKKYVGRRVCACTVCTVFACARACICVRTYHVCARVLCVCARACDRVGPCTRGSHCCDDCTDVSFVVYSGRVHTVRHALRPRTSCAWRRPIDAASLTCRETPRVTHGVKRSFSY